MKYIDRVLQRWRIRKAAPFIRRGDQVLDIGTADGALFRLVPSLGESVGVDPDLERDLVPAFPNVRFYSGYFPDALPAPVKFDVITMLAVLEHVPTEKQVPLAQACASHLKPGGRLVITVPSPAVDRVLDVLGALKLIDGMSLEQHYGFEAKTTPAIFSGHGLDLAVRQRFQLGLNNLFVFQKADAAQA
jgi:2-polyprenyl-3-methyl-5-hydroxy-6-metoxy-1,4-benzoquinol methylase